MDEEQFMPWFSLEIPECLFSQIAAQVLFRCQSCRECCRGEGYALVDEEDIRGIAQALCISPSQARARFTDPDPEKNPGCRILKSQGEERSCCFLDTGHRSCKIYHSRPKICRSFPMLSAEPENGDAICFYSDCQGTASFARMILEKRCDPQVKMDIKELTDQDELLQNLKISLYTWLRRMLGGEEEANRIWRISGAHHLGEGDFERYCLAYFLMTMRTDGLNEFLKASRS